MKILVLMPCDERMTYIAAKIYKELPNEIKDITFSMPMFMDYLVSSKIVGNWVYAFFDSFVSMKNIYKTAAKEKDDLIVFGTAPKNMKFDAIFSFQDDAEQMPYKDSFLRKVKEIVKDEPKLAAYVENLYGAEDSKFNLYNCKATAGFLAEYIKTDPKLEEIKAKYERKLKFKKKGSDDGGTSVQA